jgi:hypothetical protein
MPSYTYEERVRILAQTGDHIAEIAEAESEDDAHLAKVYAAGYVAALDAIGAIDTNEAAKFERAMEQAVWDVAERLLSAED